MNQGEKKAGPSQSSLMSKAASVSNCLTGRLRWTCCSMQVQCFREGLSEYNNMHQTCSTGESRRSSTHLCLRALSPRPR